MQQEESEDRTNLTREAFCKNEPVLHPSVSKLNRVRSPPTPRPLPAPSELRMRANESGSQKMCAAEIPMPQQAPVEGAILCAV